MNNMTQKEVCQGKRPTECGKKGRKETEIQRESAREDIARHRIFCYVLFLSFSFSFSLGSIKDYDYISFLRLRKRFFVSFFAWFSLSSPLILFDSCTCVFIYTVSSDRERETIWYKPRMTVKNCHSFSSNAMIITDIIIIIVLPVFIFIDFSSLFSCFQCLHDSCRDTSFFYYHVFYGASLFSWDNKRDMHSTQEMQRECILFFQRKISEEKKETSPQRKKK